MKGPMAQEFAKFHEQAHSNFRKSGLCAGVIVTAFYAAFFFVRGVAAVGASMLVLSIACASGVWLLTFPRAGVDVEQPLLAVVLMTSVTIHCYHMISGHPAHVIDLTKDFGHHRDDLSMVECVGIMAGAKFEAVVVPIVMLLMRFRHVGAIHLLLLGVNGLLSVWVQISVLGATYASSTEPEEFQDLKVGRWVNFCFQQLVLCCVCYFFSKLLNDQDLQHLSWVEKAVMLDPKAVSEHTELGTPEASKSNADVSGLPNESGGGVELRTGTRAHHVGEIELEEKVGELSTPYAQQLAASVIHDSLEGKWKHIAKARSTSPLIRSVQERRDNVIDASPPAAVDVAITEAGKIRFRKGVAPGRKSWLKSFLQTSFFEGVLGFVILLNSFAIALETDLGESYEDGPRSENPFFVANTFFNVVYGIEISLRIYYFRMDFFRSKWNFFELGLVVQGITDQLVAVLINTQQFGSLAMLRMLRILKLVRMVRLMRSFRELCLLIEGIQKSLRLMCWSCLLLTVLFFVCGIFCTQTIGHAEWVNLIEVEQQTRMKELFGTVPRSMYTLFQIQTLESWSEGIVRPIMQHQPAALLFFIPYVMLVTVCVLNVIVAIIVEQVMKETVMETEGEKSRLMKEARTNMVDQLTTTFIEIASDGGSISRQDWLSALELPRVQQLFASCGYDADHAVSLFDLVDLDRSGTVDLYEFVRVMLRGVMEVKHFDILAMQLDIWRIYEELPRFFEQQSEIMCRAFQEQQSESLRQAFQEMLDSARSTWASEIQGAVAMEVRRVLGQVQPQTCSL